MAKEQTPNLVTPEFRLALGHLFEPREYNGKETYGLHMLFAKSVNIDDIKKMAIAAAKKKWPGITGEEMKDRDKFFWSWGDGDTKDYDGFAGNKYVKADRTKSAGAPAVVDQNRQPLLDSNKVYNGCWGRAHIDAFAWENSGKRGVKLGVISFQLIRGDEPFGDSSGLKRAQNVFTDVAGGSEDMENYEDETPAVDVDSLDDI